MTRTAKSTRTKRAKRQRQELGSRRRKGDLTGQALIAAMQASPHRNIDIEPRGVRMPVRDVAL
jgi:hypothetical protein